MIFLYDITYRLYFFLRRMQRRISGEKIKKMCAELRLRYNYYFSLFLNRKFTPWMKRHPVKCGINRKLRDEHYTVSLTSFPTRIEYVHIAIETLMRQSFKPDRIVLWLADNQFPERILPETLTKLERQGLTIRFCEDLRSHKKYYYAFQEYPDDHIILADDDLFYPRDTIKRLVKLHKKHPKDIVCVSAQIVAPELVSLPSVWPAPQEGKRYISCWEAQAFTGAGSLFPVRWYDQEVFQKQKAMEIAATADDLWLKAMSLNNGVRTTLDHPARGFPMEIHIPQNVTLYGENKATGANRNDQAWAALVKEYAAQWKC